MLPLRVWVIGFMAVGKTTVGRALASELKFPFLDVDEWIGQEAACSITELWRREGEARFRCRERDAILMASSRPGVISVGAGASIDPRNRHQLSASGLVLWLRAPFALLWKRGALDGDVARPLWSDAPALFRLYQERERCYEFAHLTVAIGDQEPHVIAGRLADLIRSRGDRG